MWISFEEFLNEEIPECIKQILSASGYDNEISIQYLKEVDLGLIEEYLNRPMMRSVIDSLTCCSSEIYKSQEKFQILPGHRAYILNLSHQMHLKRQNYLEVLANTTTSSGLDFKERAKNEPAFSCLLKEFITNSMNNFKKIPNSRRYSEIVQDFSTYIYILCGRYCYEVISKNLPMPQVSTVCKYHNIDYNNLDNILKDLKLVSTLIFINVVSYINQKKVKVNEGELRCKGLVTYLERINAPKFVWLSEDGSGIVAKAVYDVASNLLIGLSLPINQQTGMPQTSTFNARSLEEIEKHMSQSKSTHVYIVMAQPVIAHASPFILQIYGTNNKFKTVDVLNRWTYTKSELEK